MERSPLAEDLNALLSRTAGLWDDLRGAHVLLTGGTGFYGGWLLESLLHADRELGLGARVSVLTRDEAAFRARRPRLATAPQVALVRGDVRDFQIQPGEITHVIHAAGETGTPTNAEESARMREIIVAGTRRTLDLAKSRGARRLLFASSGAVYGRQRPEVTHVTEDDPGLKSPTTALSAYAAGKREAEALCVKAAAQGLPTTIARGFAFLGAYLPLDAHFAIGNFIRDALKGGPIKVSGDGTPYRSYLYGADLAAWLWTILLKGESGRAYNVGSERRVTISELAHMVAAVAPKVEVQIAAAPCQGVATEQYVPSTRRAREELGLSETKPLEEAIRLTADWARQAS